VKPFADRPSACGKSTFLRCLNQLEIADSGTITIDGVTVQGGQPASSGVGVSPAFFSRVFGRKK